MKYGKGELILICKNIALTLAGTAILAFGTSLFIIPFDLVMGGVTGVAIALEHIFGQFMPIDSLCHSHLGFVLCGLCSAWQRLCT